MEVVDIKDQGNIKGEVVKKPRKKGDSQQNIDRQKHFNLELQIDQQEKSTIKRKKKEEEKIDHRA